MTFKHFSAYRELFFLHIDGLVQERRNSIITHLQKPIDLWLAHMGHYKRRHFCRDILVIMEVINTRMMVLT